MFEQFTHKRACIDNPSWYVSTLISVLRVAHATGLLAGSTSSASDADTRLTRYEPAIASAWMISADFPV